MRRTLIAFSGVLLLGLCTVVAGPAAQAASIFTFVKTETVTPSGTYQNADFVRIGYVPSTDHFVVTFNAMTSQSEGCSSQFYDNVNKAYRLHVYKEYTTDMVFTGNAGLVSCHGTTDTGGFFHGNDYYLASTEAPTGADGWYLAKFDAATWANPVAFWYPLNDSQLLGGDPTVAFVNGQIDVSSVLAGGTHHHTFTTDLQFVNKRNLLDTPHNGFGSMMTRDGTTYFLSCVPSVDTWSVILMQYDSSWNFLGVKTLIEHAATPQGLAFDGNRYYVAYTGRTDGFPFCENIRVAAFDTSWNLVDDIALTSHTLQEGVSAIHPYLVFRNNRLYVSYSENTSGGGIETLQAYVKVYDVSLYVAAPAIIAITPNNGPAGGGQMVTISGTDLLGATVTIGGNTATVTSTTSTSVVFTTPAHAAGAVDVIVTTSGGNATSVGGYTYLAPLPSGDCNGDGTVSAADIFHLINHLFAGGPGPAGRADVNADSNVNVADVFYLINHIFAGGPAPI